MMRQRRLIFGSSLAALALAGAFVARGVQAQATHRAAADMFHLGPAHMGSHATFNGYYDGHLDAYFNTDVSDKTQAKQMGVNFAPALAHAPMTIAPAMYFVEGNAAAHQLAVFGSEPGESDYSPLWHEVIVHWKSGAKPVVLTSDNQIDALAKKGKLTETEMMHTIINAPIIHVGKGKS